jgi:hypothetical protein
VTAALDTYGELRLAEGKLLRWGERGAKAACALQPRGLEILLALARYRFLTTGQIAELWWDGRGLRSASADDAPLRCRLRRALPAADAARLLPVDRSGSRRSPRAAARTLDAAATRPSAPQRGTHHGRGSSHPRPARQRVGAAVSRAARRPAARLGRPRRIAHRAAEAVDASDLGDGDHYVYGVDDDAVRPVQPDADGRGAVGGEGIGVASSDGRQNQDAGRARVGHRVSESIDAVDARSSLRSPCSSPRQSGPGRRVQAAA